MRLALTAVKTWAPPGVRHSSQPDSRGFCCRKFDGDRPIEMLAAISSRDSTIQPVARGGEWWTVAITRQSESRGTIPTPGTQAQRGWAGSNPSAAALPAARPCRAHARDKPQTEARYRRTERRYAPRLVRLSMGGQRIRHQLECVCSETGSTAVFYARRIHHAERMSGPPHTTTGTGVGGPALMTTGGEQD